MILSVILVIGCGLMLLPLAAMIAWVESYIEEDEAGEMSAGLMSRWMGLTFQTEPYSFLIESEAL